MATAAPDISKLPSPPTRNGNSSSPLHVAESQHIVRTRQFPTDTELAIILSDLRRSHATGTLMIDLGQGSVNGVRFREEQKF